MTAGQLRHKIRFFKEKALTPNVDGESVGGWEDTIFYECSADIKYMKGNEVKIQGAIMGVQYCEIIIRNCLKSAQITARFKAIDARNGTEFNVRSNLPFDAQGHYLTLTCETGAGL